MADIKNWFVEGKQQGATHMIVVCDTFEYEDYPVFVMPDQSVHDKEKEYRLSPMQRVMEVYNLSRDMEKQIAQERSFNY